MRPLLVLNALHQHFGQSALFLSGDQLTLNALQEQAVAFREHNAEFVQQAAQTIGLSHPLH